MLMTIMAMMMMMIVSGYVEIFRKHLGPSDNISTYFFNSLVYGIVAMARR